MDGVTIELYRWMPTYILWRLVAIFKNIWDFVSPDFCGRDEITKSDDELTLHQKSCITYRYLTAVKGCACGKGSRISELPPYRSAINPIHLLQSACCCLFGPVYYYSIGYN